MDLWDPLETDKGFTPEPWRHCDIFRDMSKRTSMEGDLHAERHELTWVCLCFVSRSIWVVLHNSVVLFRI